MLRKVLITISNIKTGDQYLARSYPHDDINGNGLWELYRTDVYYVYVDGTDSAGNAVRKTWTAPRFMPFWNNPINPNKHYRHHGWTNAGLWHLPKKVVTFYDATYNIQNRPAQYLGAIQLKDSFLIHEGPRRLIDIGAGSAGCVEIVGDFNAFQRDILDVAGSTESSVQVGLTKLVEARKLYVEVAQAIPPDFSRRLVRETPPRW